MAETPVAVRQTLFLTSLVVAGVITVLMLIEGPPGSGYGWGAVAVNIVLSAGIVVLLGWMVRLARPHLRWWTVALAALLAVVTAASTLGNWGYEDAGSQARDAVQAVLVIAFALAVVVEELGGTHRPHPLPR
ncbi:MAG TPA: hypothetical protein PLP61_03400 [Nocardioides sp.]|uniref:hypothetical protein n=1 Tax=Nocardioides sp. TaxID=35761 RepID=UPI002BF7140B|nr:hypothetical protein [Nocardioides sp.]HQR26065.1 hypothetical protein [Nocardioides sp.]